MYLKSTQSKCYSIGHIKKLKQIIEKVCKLPEKKPNRMYMLNSKAKQLKTS